MPEPTGAQNDRMAAQPFLRSDGSSIRRMGSVAFGARAAFVLVGVLALCGASAVREFELSIRERRVDAGAPTIRVKRGETVVLRWRTDEAVSLHVHGYELRANLSTASPASMRIEAAVAGRFPITAHEFGTAAARDARPRSHRELTLLYLEVLPE